MRNNIIYNTIILSVLLLISLIIFTISGNNTNTYYISTYNISYPIICYNILIFLLLGYSIFLQKGELFLRKRSYIQLNIFFWIFYFIIYYKPYIPFIFEEYIQESTFISRQFIEQSNKALTASTIGFISFMLGTSMKIKIKRVYNSPSTDCQTSKILLIISTIAVLFFGISFIPKATSMIASSYSGSEFTDLNDTINYFFLQFFLSISAINLLYQYIRKKNKPLFIYFSAIIYIIFTSLILLTGDRSGFIMLIIVPIFIFSHYIYKLNFKYIIIGGFIIYLGYNFIEVFRTMEHFSIDEYQNIVEKRKEIHGNDSSFNNTTTVTRSAFYYIDNLNQPHSYGKYSVIAALRAIPFGITTFFPDEKHYGTASILTNVCHSNFSLGSSIIAESYIEFGIIGVIVYMFLIGLLVNYFTQKLTSNKYGLLEISIYTILLSTIIILPRYTPALIIRTTIWTYLLLKTTRFFVNHEKNLLHSSFSIKRRSRKTIRYPYGSVSISRLRRNTHNIQ